MLIFFIVGVIAFLLLGDKYNFSVFSCRGKIKRFKFIHSVMAGYILLESFFLPQFLGFVGNNYTIKGLYYIGSISLFAFLISVIVRRLHDLGYDGRWVILFYGMKILLVHIFPIVDYIFLSFLIFLGFAEGINNHNTL